MESFLLLWLVVLNVCGDLTATFLPPKNNDDFGGSPAVRPGEAGYYLLADVDTAPNVGPTDELKRTQRSFWKRLLKGTGLHDLFGEEDCDDYNYNYDSGNGDAYNSPIRPPPPPLNPYYMPLPPPLPFAPLRPLRILEPLFNRYNNNVPRGSYGGGYGGANNRGGYQGNGKNGGGPYGGNDQRGYGGDKGINSGNLYGGNRGNGYGGSYGGNRPESNHHSGYGGNQGGHSGGGNYGGYNKNENAIGYGGNNEDSNAGKSGAGYESKSAVGYDGNNGNSAASSGNSYSHEGEIKNNDHGANSEGGYEASKDGNHVENIENVTPSYSSDAVPVPAINDHENGDGAYIGNPGDIIDSGAYNAGGSEYSNSKGSANSHAGGVSNAYSNAGDSSGSSSVAYSGPHRPQILYQPIIYVAPQYQGHSNGYETAKEGNTELSHDEYESQIETQVPSTEVQYQSVEPEHAVYTPPEEQRNDEINHPVAPPAPPLAPPTSPCSTCSPCGFSQCGFPLQLIPIYSPCQNCGGGGYGAQAIPPPTSSSYNSNAQSHQTYSAQDGSAGGYSSSSENENDDAPIVYSDSQTKIESAPNEDAYTAEEQPEEYESSAPSPPSASYSSNDASYTENGEISPSIQPPSSAAGYEGPSDSTYSSPEPNPSESYSSGSDGSSDSLNNNYSSGGTSSSSSYTSNGGAVQDSNSLCGYANKDAACGGDSYGNPIPVHSGNPVSYGSNQPVGKYGSYSQPAYMGNAPAYGHRIGGSAYESHAHSLPVPHYGHAHNIGGHYQPPPIYGHSSQSYGGQGIGTHAVPGITTVSTVYTILGPPPQVSSIAPQPSIYGSSPAPFYHPHSYTFHPVRRISLPRPPVTAINYLVPNQSCRHYYGGHDGYNPHLIY